MYAWQHIFSESGFSWQNEHSLHDMCTMHTLPQLRQFLDAVHIRHCLVKPFQENAHYPLVESRELLPSFDSDMWEHKHLPSFAMVAFARPLEYFNEIFQYDKIFSVLDAAMHNHDASCPLENTIITRNEQIFAARLPRAFHNDFRQALSHVDISALAHYPQLLTFLLHMDRAHVLALDSLHQFHLSGVFASFPSDIDNELKRFGVRIGKFEYGDNEKYERNRMFVYQYLMELYGFPIVSERRTSSALFARKLHKMGEHFLLRVLGQTDRTITTYTNTGGSGRYPHVDKIALVAIDADQEEAIQAVHQAGFFLDRQKRVVIMRITYHQHRFDPSNVRQERALSVARQDILHPLTGEVLQGINIIKDTTNMFLRLNDIVRGEYTGSIIYKRTEIVDGTDTPAKRLKFLYTWLTKHQRRIIAYSDDFFNNVHKVLSHYLHNPAHEPAFMRHKELYRDLLTRFNYIQQARKIRLLEELCGRTLRGTRLSYRKMLQEYAQHLNELKFEIVTYFPTLVDTCLNATEKILSDKYIVRTYIAVSEENLSPAGREIRKNYRRIVALHDEIHAVRRARVGKES